MLGVQISVGNVQRVIFTTEDSLSTEKVALKVTELTGLPTRSFYIVRNGRLARDGDICHDGTAQVVPRILGGKGGFGSMLRAIGAQIEKTTNREACRDLSGRRLRDINEEKRLKSWIDKQSSRDEEAIERKKKKLERLCAQPKHEFKDKNYERERSTLTEKVDDAVQEGFKLAAASGSGAKRKTEDKTNGGRKKLALAIDSDIDSDELGSSSDESDDSESDRKAASSSSHSPDGKSSGTEDPVKDILANESSEGVETVRLQEGNDKVAVALYKRRTLLTTDRYRLINLLTPYIRLRLSLLVSTEGNSRLYFRTTKMQPVPWSVCLILWGSVSLAAADITTHPSWDLLDHEKCGNSNTDRIIGGKNASLGAYPWIVRIGYSGTEPDPDAKEGELSYRCGGTLINKNYVVTAAHCVANLPESYKVGGVRLGEHNLNTDPDCENDFCGEPVQDIEPGEIIVHEDYNKPPFKNDMAIIRLKKEARYNDLVGPICIAKEHVSMRRNFLGETAEVAGWGIYDINDPKASPILQTLKLPVVDTSRCRKAFRSHADIGDEQMCVGGIVGQDSCGGDSGGPLMKVEAVDGPPKYYFLGVVSFGAKHCGESSTPAVYSRIAEYLRWILDNMKP